MFLSGCLICTPIVLAFHIKVQIPKPYLFHFYESSLLITKRLWWHFKWALYLFFHLQQCMLENLHASVLTQVFCYTWSDNKEMLNFQPFKELGYVTSANPYLNACYSDTLKFDISSSLSGLHERGRQEDEWKCNLPL